MAKIASIDEFLSANAKANPQWRGGVRCSACAHHHAEKINEELRAFAAAKGEGHPMPWSRFFAERLAPVYGFELCSTSILRHVRNCLGLSA